MRRLHQLARRAQQHARLRRRLGDRERARRAREVVEAQPQDHGPRHAPRRAQPPRDPVDQPDQHLVEVLGRLRLPAPPDRPLAADRAPPHADRHPPRIAIVRERVQLPARRAPEHPDQRRLRQLARPPPPS